MRNEQGPGAANAEAPNGCSLEGRNTSEIAPDGFSSKAPCQALSPTKRGITAAELQGKTFAPVDWIVPGYVAKGLTILAGKPKVGKSWLVLDVALGVSTGAPVLGTRQCKKGAVLYAALEDTQPRLRDRMAKLQRQRNNAPWPLNLTFWTRGDMARLDAGGLAQLRDWVDENPGARLIVIDTFALVRGAPRRGEASYGADYREVGAIKEFADQAGVAMILVTHLRKMASDDPWDTVTGTLGITGAADTTLMLSRDPQGVILRAMGRDVAEIETAVVFGRDDFRWRELGDAASIRRSDARKAVLEALRTAAEPMSPQAIADESGQPGANVRKLLGKMVKDDEIVKVGAGKYALTTIGTDHTDHSGHNQ